MKRIILLLALMTSLLSYGHGIKGKVSRVDGQALAEVSVYNKSTEHYTYTNLSGYFELDDVRVGDVVFFYLYGYERQELVISEENLDTEVEIILTEAAIGLDQVVLLSKPNALSKVVQIDVQNNPVKSAQEILQRVPGLVIGQHAGGGKAEQIFLRGFDIDHGTDIALQVDGLPINMVSHAHGQGYSDMHFIIPETIDNIDFGKGMYYADQGNFNTAGYVHLETKKIIDDNLVLVEAGDFNTLRNVNMIKLLDGDREQAYVASELLMTDGFFESPQNFNRINVLGRYNFNNYTDQELTLSVSHFQSKWDASGQIPVRAVNQGLIGRFGAIDDTEGGSTSRTNVWAQHQKQFNNTEKLHSSVYVSKYDFELFSNFTFFLNDPINGDQIKQKEDRTIIGANSTYTKSFDLEKENVELDLNAGIGFRYDDINGVELSRTRNRTETLSRLAFGDTDELNGFAFLSADLNMPKWTIVPGLRLDYFRFDYQDLLTPTYDPQSESEVFFGPKLNVIYSPETNKQFYVKSGWGFHSNDARVAVAQSQERALPGAFGTDVGTILKLGNKVVVNAALWSLFLRQEFVYVGDEAIVKPSGKTRRLGFDLGVRYQLSDQFYFNADLNYANARSVDDPDGQNFIPLAPNWVSTGSFNWRNLDGFSGSLRYRWVNDRPANEDNSIVAEGYFVTDFNLNYTWKKVTFGVIIENLLDTDWNETQFATESQLGFETQSFEEIHFTPGTPFFFKGRVSVRL